jgi:formylglycine-generating enzyme required for sulfatase activity
MGISTTCSQSLLSGTRLEEFVIDRVIGAGGFGITYLALDTCLNRKVVIKENLPAQFCYRDPSSMTVAPRHTHGEDADNFRWSLENFSKEAALLASLDHPGIVKVLRSFHALGTAYFTMPYVDGLALDELARQRQGKPFTEAELRGLLERVLVALAYLHNRGVYHRDIKPGNILITSEGKPVLIDFGSARQRLSERSMTVVESAGYTPFEQLQSRGNIGPWSDLYALGASIEKILTGEAPPKAADRVIDDPRKSLCGNPKWNQLYSAEFLSSIDKALSVKPTQRWQSSDEWKSWLTEPSSRSLQSASQSASASVPTFLNLSPNQIQKEKAHSKLKRKTTRKKNSIFLIFFASTLIIVVFIILISQKSDKIHTAVEESYLDLESVNHKWEGELAGEKKDFIISRGVKMTFCWCPPGNFLMGSLENEADRDSDESQVKVTFSKGFWMGETEVTQAQWNAVMGWNHSSFRGDNLPVENVSWDEAQEFISKLNTIIGSDDGGAMNLPSEAQWEYACLAGEKGPYSGGTIDQVAWYSGNSNSMTHSVGAKMKNAWGLHDMHGNVWEWCQDWYQESLVGGTDPEGPGVGKNRVHRGGSWDYYAHCCRASNRFNFDPSYSCSGLGFRVVRNSSRSNLRGPR